MSVEIKVSKQVFQKRQIGSEELNNFEKCQVGGVGGRGGGGECNRVRGAEILGAVIRPR